MIDDAVAKCRAGATSVAEALRVTTIRERCRPTAIEPSAKSANWSAEPSPRRQRRRSAAIEYSLDPIRPGRRGKASRGSNASRLTFFSRPRRKTDHIHRRSRFVAAYRSDQTRRSVARADADIGRMRVTTAKSPPRSFREKVSRTRSSVTRHISSDLRGARRVGEASGNLAPILEAMCEERQRAEALLASVRHFAVSGLPAARAAACAVLPARRAAAVRQRLQGFQRQVGSGSRHLSGISDFCAATRTRSPASGSSCWPPGFLCRVGRRASHGVDAVARLPW